MSMEFKWSRDNIFQKIEMKKKTAYRWRITFFLYSHAWGCIFTFVPLVAIFSIWHLAYGPGTSTLFSFSNLHSFDTSIACLVVTGNIIALCWIYYFSENINSWIEDALMEFSVTLGLVQIASLVQRAYLQESPAKATRGENWLCCPLQIFTASTQALHILFSLAMENNEGIALNIF